jgi:hypothetical protein
MDRVGILISAACLVHCTVLPLGLAALQFWGVNLFPQEAHTHTFHLVLAVILLGVGGFAFGQGFLRHHRLIPILLGIFGTALLFIGSLNPEHWLTHGQEHAVTIAGTLVLLVAHMKNRVACASCP